MNSTPDQGKKNPLTNPRRRWIIILLLLLLVEATCLSFTSIEELFSKATSEAVVPVSLHPAKRADYSVDPGDYLNPNINLSILIDVLSELELDEASLNDRLATVTAMLAQPIPSATPPASKETSLPLATASGTPTASSTPLPSPSLTSSATASQTAPTVTTTALATSTKTNTQPAITSTTALRTPTATRKPTRTVTRTITGTPAAPSTTTPTQTSTQVIPVTSTSTQTPSPSATKTPTHTTSATATSTPTQTQTSAPGVTHTPTSTATASLTSTPTSTTTITPTPTNSPTITPTPTNTSTTTATATVTSTSTPTSTGTQTPTPTETQTPTVTPRITSTPTPTPTDADCYPYPVDGFVPSQDTWINKNAPGQSYESDVQLHIRPVNTADRRALIQFDLTSIPAGSAILSAVLYLNDETGEEYTVLLYPIEETWPESVTWDTAPAFSLTAMGSFNLTLTPCVRAAWLDVDQVSGWVDNPSTNFGLLLYATGNAGEDLISSREGALPPKLVVDYLPPRGEAGEINSIQTTIAKAYPPASTDRVPVPPGAAPPVQPGNPMRRH